jgi:hypothetical protein
LVSHTKGRTHIERQNRVLRRILEPKMEEVTGGWRKCVMKSYIGFTLQKILLK